MSQPPEPTVLPVKLSAKSKNGPILPLPLDPLHMNTEKNDGLNRSKTMPVNYKNGRKVEPKMFNFNNYYTHREKLPKHYHSLVQFLEDTEVKYHNDNLFENSSIGFPTRAQILKERKIHLPILKESPEEKARYKRKKEEFERAIQTCRQRHHFKTHDGFSDHYFLTGARFNRNDTIDSKILKNYGMFLNRHDPSHVYIKSSHQAFESISEDLFKMNIISRSHTPDDLFKSKSCQVVKGAFMQTAKQNIERNKNKGYNKSSKSRNSLIEDSYSKI